ncbi:MAG: DUF2027 domain-containing protein [Bacteroidota bacterium]
MSKTEQYKTGDKVRFLNDVGGGMVKRIQKDGSLIIETQDGFEYPADAEDLVLIERGAESMTQKSAGDNNHVPEPEKMKVEENRSSYHILLAFIRDDTLHKVNVFLINDSPYYLNFALYQTKDNAYKLVSQDVLEPDTKIELLSVGDRDLNDFTRLSMQGFFTGNKMESLKPAIEAEFKVKPAKLIQQDSYSASDYFVEDAIVQKLYSTDITAEADIKEVLSEKEIQEKYDFEKARRSKKHPEPVIWEEDLHINELVESVVGMSNHEILNHQMSYFHEVLNEAIKEQVNEVVFIHGIGNGTLKATLRKSLEKDYKLYYEDASFKEYGFGATRVFPMRKA